MNRRFLRYIAGALILAFTTLPLYATSPTVDYLDGHLEYQSGRDTWIELKTGNEIPEGSTVRLSGRGYAELSIGSRFVALSSDGVYNLGELFTEEPEKHNFRQVLGAKFGALLGRGRVSDTSAQAAVRQNEVETEETLFDGNYMYNGKYYYSKAMEYAAEGKYKEAELEFRAAYREFDGGVFDALDDAEEREFTFWKGLCLDRLGEYRESREVLTGLQPEIDDPYIADYTLVVASLYMESREYQKADRVMNAYLETEPRGEAAQSTWLLSAYSLLEQDRVPEADRAARNAVNLGPETDIGKAAADLIQ